MSENGHLNNNKIFLAGAVIKLVNLESRTLFHRYELALLEGVWPSEAEMKLFFESFSRTKDYESEIEVSFQGDIAFVSVEHIIRHLTF